MPVAASQAVSAFQEAEMKGLPPGAAGPLLRGCLRGFSSSTRGAGSLNAHCLSVARPLLPYS